MKKTSLHLIIIILSSFVFSSCTSTKKVQEHLDYNKQSVIYLMDSAPSKEKLNHTLSITSVKLDSSIRQKSLAVKKTGWVVPLLFFNIWESEKTCYQGESMFEHNWANTLKTNFLKESDRSGIFIVDTASNYQLEFSIDKLEAKGPYYSQGFIVFAIFFHFQSFGDYAGPAETELAISYKLKKDGNTVHENTFRIEKTTEQLKKGYKNKKELIQGFATSMAEATSDNFKNVIESIVQDLNGYFENEVD